jgi:pimeloyl-ACP methyl ester carboxylesterase
VAPDLRGYGDSSVPSDAVSHSALHVVGDVVALIDSLGQEKVLTVTCLNFIQQIKKREKKKC